MRLPEELLHAMDLEVARIPLPEITRAAQEISEAYRKGEFAKRPLKSGAHRLAYLQVRMPATFAACRHVFARTREVLPDFAPQSLLDLGAGPGTAAWAAVEHFPSVQKISAIERDPELMKIGRSLALASAHPALQGSTWIAQDLRTAPLDPHDIIVLSYAIGELNAEDARAIVHRCWKATQLLVLIEPGTPKAFARIAEIRKQLIADNATIAAPCPHEKECPLRLRNDWCHFAERLERTSEHRRMKGGSLGYEDEKFSYLAASRLPANRVGRIVRHPLIHSGYVQLQVCGPDDLKQITITKSQKELYRPARKAEWGDRWPPPSTTGT
jgi:ribosomal protein RSM22 (predicted rRNA methylase)